MFSKISLNLIYGLNVQNLKVIRSLCDINYDNIVMLKELEISVLSGKIFSYGFIHAHGRYILYNCIYFNTILMSPMYCLSLFSLIQTFFQTYF